jgi:acylphosphatase
LPARIRMTVYGMVQGVGFRYFTLRLAKKLKVSGYVRNTSKGNVEVVAEGDKHSLLRLVEELRIGPPGSFVDNLHIKWEDPKNEFDEFRILR